MGTINGIYEEKTLEPKTLLLGGNVFETGTLTVPAGDDINIPEGAVLTRDSNGKYKVAEDTDGALFVLVDHIITPITAAGDYAVRVCIKGDLNRNLVTIGGEPLTDAQVDAMRQNGIFVRTVYDVK